MNIEKIKEIAYKNNKEIKHINNKSEEFKTIKEVNKNTLSFLVEGIWLHEQTYKNNIEVNSIFLCPKLLYSKRAEEITIKFIEITKKIYIIESEKHFIKVSNKDSPQGIISLCSYKDYKLKDIELEKNNLVIILDKLETPGNIGTIIRSMDGIKGQAVILTKTKEGARINHPNIITASQATCFNIPFLEESYDNIHNWLKTNNFTTFLLEPESKSEIYTTPEYKGNIALVVGNERYGLSNEIKKSNYNKIYIPMLGNIDSLNAGVAASIVIYEAGLKQQNLIKR